MIMKRQLLGVSTQREFTDLNAYIRQEKNILNQVSKFLSYEAEEKIKPKASSSKKLIKMTAEINETENKHTRKTQ